MKKKPMPLVSIFLVIAIVLAILSLLFFQKDFLFSKIVEQKVDNNKNNKVVIANGEWEPYFSENLENNGFVSSVVSEAFAEEGVDVEFVFLPWSRGFDEASLGKWDGTMGWAKTPEREELFIYSQNSITDDNHVFFYLKNSNFDWKTVKDLKGIKIAANDGFFYGEEMDKAEKDGLILLDRGIEDQLAIKKLLAGKVDVAILDKRVGYKLINTSFTSEDAEKITHHPISVVKSKNHFLLNKINPDNERFMKLFDKGYQKMIDSGKIDQYWKDFEAGKY